MCRVCENFTFRNWETIIIGARVRFQCPVCKRFFGYLTKEEYDRWKIRREMRGNDGTAE